MRAKRQHNKESGMAMVLVITILAALLGIAAVGLSLQLNSTKSTALVKDTRAALYCAEAGLAGARATLVANRDTWGDVLSGTTVTWYNSVPPIDETDPTLLPLGISGDIDGDAATFDYSVTIRDDGDDGDPLTDNNDTIVVTSTCVLYSNTAPASVTEVVSLLGQGGGYNNQGGQGEKGDGNATGQ